MRRACVFLLPMLMLAGLSACSVERDASGTRERRSDLQALLQRISADSIASSARSLSEKAREDKAVGDREPGGQVARWIYARLNSFGGSDGRLRVSYDRHSRRGGRGVDREEELVNVMAVLPGTQMESRDRIYIVCSPYPVTASGDSTSARSQVTGDPASGSAVLLELARVMSNFELDATIVFLAVDGREGGAPAARAFARQVRRRNLDLDAVLSTDLGGSTGGTRGELRVFAEGIPAGEDKGDYYRTLLASGGENDTPSRNLARFLHRVAGNHVPGLEAVMVYGNGSQREQSLHGAFLHEGYPAVRLAGNGAGEGESSAGGFSWLAGVTRLNAAAMATLADAPEYPRHVRLDRSESGLPVRLRWRTNDEPDLRGYQVVWRRTTSPYWEHVTFAGDTTAFDLDGFSPFYYLFGVRAVDRHGNTGPAVFPLERH